jgi:hypothetical protein
MSVDKTIFQMPAGWRPGRPMPKPKAEDVIVAAAAEIADTTPRRGVPGRPYVKPPSDKKYLIPADKPPPPVRTKVTGSPRPVPVTKAGLVVVAAEHAAEVRACQPTGVFSIDVFRAAMLKKYGVQSPRVERSEEEMARIFEDIRKQIG